MPGDDDEGNYLGNLILLAIALVVMAVIAVIVGVVWTASTGRSGQRIYLWSALIGMGIFWLFGIWGLLLALLDINEIVNVMIIPTFIVFGIGFFITGMIHPDTGPNTNTTPYLISAVVSMAVILLWSLFLLL